MSSARRDSEHWLSLCSELETPITINTENEDLNGTRIRVMQLKNVHFFRS